MRISRFDPSVGRHVDRFGSDFRLSPIALLDEPVRVFAFHLEAGGRVGRHTLETAQLLCVTSGNGWVAGADGEPHRVSAGHAVLWEAGEEHEVWTDFDELSAVALEGQLTVWGPVVLATAFSSSPAEAPEPPAMESAPAPAPEPAPVPPPVVAAPAPEPARPAPPPPPPPPPRPPIVIADPDPAWAQAFVAARDGLAAAFRAGDVHIDHVGSTAVPGMPARPVLDVDVIVSGPEEVEPAARTIERLGYRRERPGEPGRVRFAPSVSWPVHVVSVVVAGSEVHVGRVLLREHLKANPEDARQLAEAKRWAASEAEGDIERYRALRRPVLDEVAARAGGATRGAAPSAP